MKKLQKRKEQLLKEKRKKHRIADKVTSAFELPAEVLSGAARMIIVDNKNLYVENHKGILEYTGVCIKVLFEKYILNVKGTDLYIKEFEATSMVVSGNIYSLEYILG